MCASLAEIAHEDCVCNSELYGGYIWDIQCEKVSDAGDTLFECGTLRNDGGKKKILSIYLSLFSRAQVCNNV